jgi:hypothetical protein
MAKSARSSVKKSNKSKLRARVFEPVEDARTERLSAKLLQLVTESASSKLSDTSMELVEKGMKAHLFSVPFRAQDTNLQETHRKSAHRG